MKFECHGRGWASTIPEIEIYSIPPFVRAAALLILLIASPHSVTQSRLQGGIDSLVFKAWLLPLPERSQRYLVNSDLGPAEGPWCSSG